MRISNAASRGLTASAVLTMLAGCGGSSQMTPTSPTQSGTGNSPIQRAAFQNGRLDGFLATRGGMVPAYRPARPSFMDPGSVGKPLVFVSYGATIDIYLQDRKNKLVGQISVPSLYLATDTAGDLYSANSSVSSSSVTVYAPPYTSGPKLTLSTREASAVAVSRQGTVAVVACTIPSGSQCADGVVFYAAGSTTPCATVPLYPSPFPNGVFGITFDRTGNLYVDSTGSGTSAPLTVGKIDGGCNAKKVKTFITANSIAFAGDIKVDKAGRLAILAAAGTSPYTVAIDAYDPPKKGSLGNPVSSTSLLGNISSGPFPSGAFAFMISGRGLWAGYENVGPSDAAGAYEFAYRAGGTPEKTIIGAPDTFTYGVSVTPPLVP